MFIKPLTELRVTIKQRETLIGKYISSHLAGDIKNLTLKEDWFMLEELKMQREEYAAELERLRNSDLEAIKNARFELVKEEIAREVEAEFNEKLAEAELNVKHYDFVIEKMEAKALENLEQEVQEENMEG